MNSRRGKQVLIAAVSLGVLGVGGCGNPQEVIQSGTVGTNAQAGPVLLRNVHLAATENGYRPGDDADAQLSLVNQAPEWDALVSARSPDARQVNLRWDRGCDGQAEVVPRIPVSARGTVPASAGQPTGATPYHLEIVDVSQLARPGTTFPLTLTFERAGEVTLEAKVQATRDGDQPPPRPCQRQAAPPGQPPPGTPPGATTGRSPAPAPAREITVVGTVEAGAQPGCLLLTDGGRPYVLLGGDPALVHPGSHVVVRGRPDPGVPTTCGHGVTLHVINALPTGQ